jgi:hypothetical protein
MGVSILEMSGPIFFSVLMKSRLMLLPLSMSTQVSCEPDTKGSKMSGNFPGSEKLIHYYSLEKEIGTSLYLKGYCMASSTDRISHRVSFCAHLVGKPPSPPKITLMTFTGCWKPCAPNLSPSSSSLSFPFAS